MREIQTRQAFRLFLLLLMMTFTTRLRTVFRFLFFITSQPSRVSTIGYYTVYKLLMQFPICSVLSGVSSSFHRFFFYSWFLTVFVCTSVSTDRKQSNASVLYDKRY